MGEGRASADRLDDVGSRVLAGVNDSLAAEDRAGKSLDRVAQCIERERGRAFVAPALEAMFVMSVVGRSAFSFARRESANAEEDLERDVRV